MIQRPATVVLCALLAASQAHAQAPRIAPASPPRQALRLPPQPVIAPASEQRALAGQARLSPAARAFAAQRARLVANGADGSEAATRAAIGQAGLGNMADGDINELCFLVLMQAAEDAEADLRQTMEQVKTINVQKQAQREALQKQQQAAGSARPSPQQTPNLVLRPPPPAPPVYTLDRASRPALQAQSDKLKSDLDSLGEMSEMDQLQLQQIMDRRAKALETLSNLMKKASDTQSNIVKNLK